MGIQLDYASVYHPQTSGQVKHANGLVLSGIKPCLVRSLKETDCHWVEELHSILCGLHTVGFRDPATLERFKLWGACGDLNLPSLPTRDPP